MRSCALDLVEIIQTRLTGPVRPQSPSSTNFAKSKKPSKKSAKLSVSLELKSAFLTRCELNTSVQKRGRSKAGLRALGTDPPHCAQIYKRDIERLLAMEDMWKHRKPPVPLSFDDLESSTPSTSTATKSINGIKDQRELSLHDSFQLFKDSLDRLVARVTAAQDPESALMDWDKDDDDALDFATATANLRAHIFGIPSKTRFDVKREVQLEQGFIFAPQTAESSHICCAHLLFFLLEMAGNIIPAIATTNAIVAGLIVLQALKVLKKQWSDLRLVYVSRQMDTAVSSTEPPKPNPHCAVCRTPYVNLSIDTSKVTIDQFVQEIARDKVGYPGDLAVRDGSRILYDPDEEENGSKTLAQMGITPTTLLTVDDEEGNLTSTVFVLTPSVCCNSLLLAHALANHALCTGQRRMHPTCGMFLEMFLSSLRSHRHRRTRSKERTTCPHLQLQLQLRQARSVKQMKPILKTQLAKSKKPKSTSKRATRWLSTTTATRNLRLHQRGQQG